MTYLEWRRRAALRDGEGYGDELLNEPEPFHGGKLAHPVDRRPAAAAGRA